ncbi:TetR/AcrR family transcriptional regulator [Cohnella algarum]|nr:TetR/AcrR family transcriptional regulator [Cohnella algarum]
MAMDEHLDRRIRKTRQALKEALVALILEKGYDAVTIIDIADRADYNRGTFYNHYAGKEELLSEIHGEFLRRTGESLLEPYKGMERVAAADIYPSILLLFEHIEKHKDEFTALLSVDRKLALELNDALRESMRRDMHIEMEPGAASVDYEILLSYQMSATVGVIMHWAETRFKYSARFMAEQLHSLVNGRIAFIQFKR